jgi:hypothetical protein
MISYWLKTIIASMIYLLVAVLLAGCQTQLPTVVDKRAWGNLDAAEQLDLTFVNQWDGSIGPPKLRGLGEAFLSEMTKELASYGVKVDTRYTNVGGFIKGRYRVSFSPVITYNRRPGQLCFRVELFDRTHNSGLTAVWSAWIWTPPLDQEEKSSSTEGYGAITGQSLAIELISQLQHIGIVRAKRVSSTYHQDNSFNSLLGADALRRAA